MNAFVGAMVGIERTLLPEIAEKDFGMIAKSAILSFIVVFGLAKAFTNYFAGRFSDHYGRKIVLIFGWLFAIPVPFLIIQAPNWPWILWANVFLGVSQGLTWSTTVTMKIDLVGPKQRGLAMGLNESNTNTFKFTKCQLMAPDQTLCISNSLKTTSNNYPYLKSKWFYEPHLSH